MRKSLTGLASVAFIGGMFGRGLRYSLNIVIANGLGTGALGYFAFGMVVMKAGGVIARLGLDNAAQKFVPKHITDENTSALSGIALFCLAVPFLAGVVITGFIFALDFQFDRIFGVSLSPTSTFTLGIPFFATMMVGIAVTKGLKETKYQVYIRDIGQSVVAIALVAIGAYVIQDLTAVIYGYVLSFVVGTALVLYFLVDENVISFSERPKVNPKTVLAFSLPLTLAAVIQYLLTWTDILMLGVFMPPSDVGKYQAAYQTSVLLLVVLQAVNSIFPSMVSDLYERNQWEQLQTLFEAITKWITYITILGCLFVSIYAKEILGLFGAATPDAQLALIILCLGQTAAASTGPSGYLLIMTNHERLQLVNTTVVGFLNFVLNYFLINQFGIVGAAMATAISFGVLNLLRIAEIYHFLGVQPYSRRYWKGVVALACSTPILILGSRLPVLEVGRIFTGGIIALPVFVAVIWLLGIEDGDRSIFEKI
ncbi:polysaccharide biosynthesis protein [Haladaptatus sp. W1]|uniref:flippase n=1 Tax=Haladaptatus sp. W1 TaxID=1897478 RepID=UPI000849D995|nr:flippase [Haladaptatus sp. W1]ODR80576.1 polysaccharide biosynthesis protein [Haladaptatus sp. W1]